jgi:sphingosine kinase
MFRQASVEYQLVVTTHAGHARSFMAASHDLSAFTAVVAVGGDGLLSEIVNGMNERGDSPGVFSHLALAVIHAGSGNGLAKSVLHESGEHCDTLSATFCVLKGRAVPMDLSRVTVPGGPEKGYLSFLSLSWAIISDVDIESEKYRFLGPARFTVGALARIIWLRRYPGTLSYLRAAAGSSCVAAIPRLGEALPLSEDWVSVADDFVMLWVCQTSHAAEDMFTSPASRLSDGKFTILVLRNRISRLELLGMFLAIENGTHIAHPALEVYEAAAYRLVPGTTSGMYSLDGEVIEYGPVQGVIEAGMARIISLSSGN